MNIKNKLLHFIFFSFINFFCHGSQESSILTTTITNFDAAKVFRWNAYCENNIEPEDNNVILSDPQIQSVLHNLKKEFRLKEYKEIRPKETQETTTTHSTIAAKIKILLIIDKREYPFLIYKEPNEKKYEAVFGILTNKKHHPFVFQSLSI